MLKVWNGTGKHLRMGAPVFFTNTNVNPQSAFARYDPLLRCLTGPHTYVVPMDPVSESGLFSDSFHGNVGSVDFIVKPVNSKVRDMYPYDHRHYGSFVDSIQDFWSILTGGDTTLSSPAKVHSQHYVRHRSFKGQAATGILDLTDGVVDLEGWESLMGFSCTSNHYTSARLRVAINPSGVVDYEYPGGEADAYDITPVFDFLSSREKTICVNVIDGALFTTTITNFRYDCSDALNFSYDAHTIEDDPSGLYTFTYHFYYRGGKFEIISDLGEDPRIVGLGTAPSVYGVTVSSSNYPAFSSFEYTTDYTYGRIIGVPSSLDVVDSVGESVTSRRLFSVARPFWHSVELNWWDITALSRDTATIALNRLSQQAFEPAVGRLGAINPLTVSRDSLLAQTANAALGDFFRKTLKDLLRPVGGAGLVRYRTVLSDVLQISQSLEVLDSLRNEPSRLYSANAHFVYPVVLGDRECVITVRSKVYLELSPFRLLQILIGKQAVTIINDLLALYYTSIPLGEILLTLLQLRKVSDIITSRMFYDLPMFFVHSYSVESPLTKAELDYVGISNLAGKPAAVTYYGRDVSQYLPVLRHSALAAFYGTGDVGNIIWSLLQLIVGAMS